MNEPLWIVVPAAGSGVRMGREVPKQYITIGEHSLLQHTLSRLLMIQGVSGVVVSLSESDEQWQSVPASQDPRVHSTIGGSTRADSVLAGLQFVRDRAPESTWVLVHDAARPLVALSDVKRLTDAVYNSGAVGGLLATPVHDTLKRADAYCCVEHTVSRESLWQAQTPQLFRVGELAEALLSAGKASAPANTPARSANGPANGPDNESDAVSITDESSAMEHMGHEPLLVEALQPNLKVTRPADLVLAGLLLANPVQNS